MVVFTIRVVQHFFWKQRMSPTRARRSPQEPVATRTTPDPSSPTYGGCGSRHRVVVSDPAPLDDGLARAIPSWLEQLGLLAYKEEKAARSIKSMAQSVVAKTFRQLDKRLSPEAKHRLARRFPWARSRVEVMMSFAKIDWSRTLAYTDGKRPEIWINLKGRQNQGIVDPADYDKVRQQIIDAIEPAVNAKTGEPLCRKVWRREEAYDGPYVERSPDLVIEWLDARPTLDVKQADGRVLRLEKHHLPDDPFDRLLSGGHDHRHRRLAGHGVSRVASKAPTSPTSGRPCSTYATRRSPTTSTASRLPARSPSIAAPSTATARRRRPAPTPSTAPTRKPRSTSASRRLGMSNRPVLLLGLDGLGQQFLDSPLVAEAAPNLVALLRAGGVAPLRSTFPPYTAPAWTSITTGVGPGRHGVFGFTDADGRPVGDTSVGAPRLWDYVGEGAARCPHMPINIASPDQRRVVSGMPVSPARRMRRPPSRPDDYIVDVAYARARREHRHHRPADEMTRGAAGGDGLARERGLFVVVS